MPGGMDPWKGSRSCRDGDLFEVVDEAFQASLLVFVEAYELVLRRRVQIAADAAA